MVFTTGRGTPLGFPAPTLKISSNSPLAQANPNWNDFYAGRMLTGDQQALTEAWHEGVDQEREDAAKAQREARDTLSKNNIEIVTASKDAITEMRRRLMATQDAVVAEIGMDRDLVANVLGQIRAAGVAV